MSLKCPQCGNDIASDDVNIQSVVAKCDGCGNVFGFAGLVPGAVPSSKPQIVEPPRGCKIENLGTEVRITRRWFSPLHIFLLFFAVMWNGFLVGWFGTVFTHHAPWFFKIFPIGHVAVGLFLLYTVVTGFFNKTVVRISPLDVTVHHGPIPAPGNKTVPRTEIDQLFCERIDHHGKNGVHYTYNVMILDRAGKRTKLLTNLTDRDQGAYFEQQIEKVLGIQDRPVAGEA